MQESKEEPVAEAAETVKQAQPTVSGEASSFSFEAETKQLLDIVANSLYTDKEVNDLDIYRSALLPTTVQCRLASDRRPTIG